MKAFFRFIHENQLFSAAVILAIALVVCFHINAQSGRFSYLRGDGWKSQRIFDSKTGSLYIPKRLNFKTGETYWVVENPPANATEPYQVQQSNSQE